MIFDRQQQHLLLEGKEYTPEDIARFIAEGAENTPSALWDLYLFLNEWFNDSPVITVHWSYPILHAVPWLHRWHDPDRWQ